MPKPDPAHKETDKILRDMEKRLDEVYKQAYREARQTADDFMKQFREMDKIKRQQVKDGELDKAEYDRWRRTQVFQGNRYHQMADTLAADMTHTNQIAASVINGYLPEVYAVNHNYGTYEIEKGSRINTQYTMYDKQTVERLIRDNPNLLPRKAAVNVPKDQLWNKKHINSAVMQGIIQGDPIDKISQRLAATVTDMSHTSAIRNARTMTTSAQNGGRIDSYKRAESMGIKILQVWMATLDSRTRHEHRQLDGQKRKVGEPFEVEGEKIFFPGDPAADPALVYNCFVGDTKVASDSELIRSYKHKYSGQVITVKTAKGVNFTCTPNHPILTPFGWIAADRLNKGDNILVTIIGDKSTLRRYSDIDHIHPRIETVHNSFKSNGLVSRNSPLTVNFHGDIPTSDIEIVTKKRLLRFNRNACFYKLINKFLLIDTNESLVRKCTVMKHFGSVMRTSFSNISRKCKSFPFFWRSLSHSNIHGFRTISRSDAVLTEYPIDNLATESVIDGELLDRLSGKVFLDKIIDINVCVLKTHVYNLQTKNGYYFANSIIPQNSQKCNGIFAIAKNCRCTLIGEVEGVDYNLSDVSQRDNKLGDMTYEEWKEEKRKQDNAEPPAPKPKAEDKPVEVEVPAPTVEKPDAVDETITQKPNAEYKSDIIVKTNEELGEVLENTELTFRGIPRTNPMSDWGHAMFADEGVNAYFPDDIYKLEKSDRHAFFVEKNQLTSFDDVKDIIIQTWEDDRRKDILSDYGFSEEQMELKKEELLELFNPSDIVDDALGFDSLEFTTWFKERIAEENNIDGIKTNDGAIVFNKNIIHEIVPNPEKKEVKKEGSKPKENNNSEAMQEYLEFKAKMEQKYGANLWLDMTDAEMDKLEELERKAHKGR